jgi:hypothetical protein
MDKPLPPRTGAWEVGDTATDGQHWWTCTAVLPVTTWHPGETVQYGPSGGELRARYGKPEPAGAVGVLALLNRSDVDPAHVLAFRYPSAEACQAFAVASLQHHGHASLGPIETDLGVFGVVLLPEEANHG